MIIGQIMLITATFLFEFQIAFYYKLRNIHIAPAQSVSPGLFHSFGYIFSSEISGAFVVAAARGEKGVWRNIQPLSTKESLHPPEWWY